MKHLAAAIAMAAAVALSSVAIVRGTWAVGGSDSSCYALMADALAHGRLQPLMPLAERAPWTNAPLTFAPAGFIPSPVRRDAASPVCAPGCSLLMVPFRWIAGPVGIFLVTPAAAALLVWCVFVATRDLAGGAAGALAAVIVATTPIVLFQAVQPMNDVLTAALWMGVVAAAGREGPRRCWLIGALTGLAILVRPNLAPVALVVAMWVLRKAVRARSSQDIAAFALAAAPGIAVTACFNWALYGSPFRVGYGNASDLFSASYVGTNVAHYGRAALDTLTPFPVVALVAPFVVERSRRPVVWLAFAMAAATVAVYLFYRPFDEWWYLRFLLPAVSVSIVLASAAAALILRRSVFIAALAVLMAGFGYRTAVDRQAFNLQRLEARFRDTAGVVRDRLPVNALLFTVFQSGSVRFHAGREAVLWDSLEPSALEGAITWAHSQGFEPFLLLERWEEPLFRARFAERAPLGALDWPPRFEIDRQVRIYAPSDRAAYLSGQPVPTAYVWPR